MARSTRPRGAAARGNAVTPAAQQVSVWEDDPELGIQITRPLPTRPSALSHITFLAELGARLPVLLDQGVDLNAYYDRQALNFFHGRAPSIRARARTLSVTKWATPYWTR